MNILSKNILAVLQVGVILLLVAKIIGVAVYMFLPAMPVTELKRVDITPPYIRVSFGKLFGIAEQTYEDTATQDETPSIDSIILKGITGKEQYGAVVVADRATPQKTKVVSVGESFEGYVLKRIALDYVVFTKFGKEYKVMLEKRKPLPVLKEDEGSATFAEAQIPVLKDDIQHFAAHPNEIWRNISIQPQKRDGMIQGFKVRWIRSNSKFAHLGIKAGDLIIKANNKRLRSYKDAIDIYKNISKLKEVSIVVLRNNEEKEFIYEIQ
jgi:type II secretion system protein C